MGVPPTAQQLAVAGKGAGLIVDRGNQWEVGGRDLLKGCQLIGP